jgi:hypothetical protein
MGGKPSELTVCFWPFSAGRDRLMGVPFLLRLLPMVEAGNRLIGH